jgi:putative copper resistance protein D
MPPSAVWWLTDWRPTWLGVVLAVAAAAFYGRLLVRGRRAGVRWPWWRVVTYGLLGVGSLAYATCGPLEVHRSSIFWVAALQVGVLSAIAPAGLAAGDPVGLARAVPGSGEKRTGAVLRSWPLRILTFPLVASALAVGSVVSVLFTGYLEASTRSSAVEAVLVVQLLTTGLLFVLPLLSDDLLPAWATPPVRALVAFGDGLLDALPGILLMVSTTVLSPGYPGFAGLSPADALWEQRWGGGVLLGATEIVGVPVLAAIFVDWVRRDEREAREVDALLDLEQPPPENLRGQGSRGDQSDDAADRGRPDGARPWWEGDPRFADRIYRRR